MRHLQRALAATLLALAAWAAHAEVDRERLVSVSASVLKIEAHRQQGGYSLGSGVMVAAEHVVTNCHVTRDAREIFVQRGGVRWRVLAQATDMEHDLCLLRVPGVRAEAVPLGRSATLKTRQSVTAVGFTGGQGIQTSAGEVVALHRLDGGQVIQSTNWFTSGASGGALFDDDMRLVGVLTFRLLGGEQHYFAAPVEWLRVMLSDDQAFQPVAPAKTGALPYWQRVMPLQPNFLQAITLERDRKWPELEALAARWQLADAADPTPLTLRGLALEGQGRLPEALHALERALEIAPESGLVWYRMALVLARQGDRDRLRQARSRLQSLDPARLPDLDAATAKI